jgi:hypothetical protein
MKKLLSTALASLASLAVLALLAAPAHAKTKVLTYGAGLPPVGAGPNPQPGGAIQFTAKFTNSAKNRKRFEPKTVTEVRFESVPLSCSNAGPPGPNTQLLLTRTLATSIPVKAAPPPVASKPKKNRYAFRFNHSFSEFTGTLTTTIDKPNVRKKNQPARAHGLLTITDLDEDATHFNCATDGPRGFSALRPQS